jgi:GH25 family lysozyme M1 (1,4-beta-N-acetylmuramidase)
MIDMEGTAGLPKCYSKSASAMVAWIQDFVNTYHAKTGRYPMIYTNRDWWTTCTGNSAAFSEICPLVFASWNSVPGPLPGVWSSYTIWQNSDNFPCGGDSDIFNGDLSALQKFAKGS